MTLIAGLGRGSVVKQSLSLILLLLMIHFELAPACLKMVLTELEEVAGDQSLILVTFSYLHSSAR